MDYKVTINNFKYLGILHCIDGRPEICKTRLYYLIKAGKFKIKVNDSTNDHWIIAADKEGPQFYFVSDEVNPFELSQMVVQIANCHPNDLILNTVIY